MEALLLALFAAGLGLGLIVRAIRPPQPKPKCRSNDRLDDVDHMVLYGEVTGDDFYGM